ncbi:hypothetical protein HMI54_010402 [Coelomomyces lativittatus]|nr:hypothetical protein HMI54_010402 [Coelomomyces lativittatus]
MSDETFRKYKCLFNAYRDDFMKNPSEARIFTQYVYVLLWIDTAIRFWPFPSTSTSSSSLPQP